jgi:hypothetical protein
LNAAGRDQLNDLFSDQVKFTLGQLEVAHLHEMRLDRLWQSHNSVHQTDLPKVMAVLWGLDQAHVENSLVFQTCIQASVLWVRSIEADLEARDSSAFPSALKVLCLLMSEIDF